MNVILHVFGEESNVEEVTQKDYRLVREYFFAFYPSANLEDFENYIEYESIRDEKYGKYLKYEKMGLQKNQKFDLLNEIESRFELFYSELENYQDIEV